MAHRAGLHQVKKSVRSKSGKTVQRSYWVKGADAAKAAGGKIKGAARAAGGFLSRHKGKIAAGVGLAAAAYGAHKGHQFVKGYKGMGMSHGDAAKAIFGGLKDRAKGAATSGAHAVVGAGARAHKYASEFRGKVKGSLEHRSSGVPGAVRNAAQGLRKDVRKAVGEGRKAAQTTPGNSKLAAFREGASIAAQSFKTRRRQRAGE